MKIQEEEISSIEGISMKCLGQWFKESLIDKNSIDTQEEIPNMAENS